MTNPAVQLRLFRSGQVPRPRYGSLLLILVVTYLLSAFTSGRLVDTVQVVLFLAVVLIALRNGRFQRKTVQILAVGLLLGSGVSAILRIVDDSGDGGALASLWTAMILALAVILIVWQVVSQPRITGQSIYGVLSAYMIIGLIFSAVYVAMWKFGGPFFVPGESANTQTFQYFSFTTLTTLGYGDFTAAGDGGRAVAVLEAIVGQMFLATLVARLVAGFRWSDRAAARRAGQQTAPAAVQSPDASGAVPDSGPGESALWCAAPAGRIPRGGPRPVPGQEGLGSRPDPAEPARRGPGTRNRSAPRRAEGDRGVRPGPRPPPHGAGLNEAAPEHRVSGGTQDRPGVRFPSPPRRAWPARR